MSQSVLAPMTRLGARLLESRNTTSPFAFQPSTFVRRRPLPATTVCFNRSVSKDTKPHAEPRCRRRYPLAEPLITSMAFRGRILTGLFNLIMHFLGDEKRTSPLQVDRIWPQRADGNSASGCVYYLLVSSIWIPTSRCCCYLSRLSKHTKADMTQMKHPRGSLSQPFDVKKMSQKKKTYVPSSPICPKNIAIKMQQLIPQPLSQQLLTQLHYVSPWDGDDPSVQPLCRGV